MRWRPGQLQTDVGPIRLGMLWVLLEFSKCGGLLHGQAPTGPGMLGPKSEVWARETGCVDQNNVMRWKPRQLPTEVGTIHQDGLQLALLEFSEYAVDCCMVRSHRARDA